MDVDDDRLGGNVKSIRRESFIESFGIQEVVEEDAGAGRRDSLSVDDLELDASEDDRRHSSSRGESHGSSSSRAAPPNFAGGHARRKGDRSHRARKKFSFGLDAEENRRASTGAMSVQESFGDMSLQSFTSASSFTSSAGDNNKNVALGNLIFVTDEEMAQLMYGKDKDVGSTENSMDSSDGRPPLVSRRSSDMSTGSDLSASLPPSATLGTGAFSTVRLAWRRTPDQTIKQSAMSLTTDADGEPSTSFQEVNEDHTDRQRRSVVRVQSNQSDADPCAPFKHKGQLVAVKIIQKSILKQMKSMQRGPDNRMTVQTAFDNIEREIATMKRLRHPNLVRLYEVIDSVESDRLHMVLEYVSLGEILSHVEGTNRYTRMRYKRKVRGLTEDGHFDEKHAALYFVDILHGLAYLHRNRICHRDLKPENILLCHSGIAKISDFGVAHMFEDEQDRESYMMSALEEEDLDGLMSDNDGVDDSARSDGQIHLSKHESDVAYNMSSRHDRGMLKKTEGTWCFWSPEMCNDDSKGFSGYSSDLWAAGVCLYIFTTGKLPFFSMMPSELFDLIAKAQVRYKGLVMSDELKDLLGKLLRKDPSTRAGVGDCLKHEFCADARAERLGELDNKFRKSEEHIILSKNDVATALSITMPNKKKHGVFRKAASKRLSAPEIMMSSASQPITAAKLKKDSNLTVLTEASAEEKGGHKVSDTSACSPGLTSKNSFKRVGLASKFKLKKWWHRRRDS